MEQKVFASYSDKESAREKENRQIAYEAACEGIVLLKNDGTLPVKKGRIALFGSGASRTIKGGTGSGEVNERYSVTILEGLKKAGYEITTESWIDAFERERENAFRAWSSVGRHIGDIINDMENSFNEPYGPEITDEDIKEADCETAIYVVSRQAGEGRDKRIEDGEFDLSGHEIKNIEKMAAGFKNSVLVINSGSYMNIGRVDEKVSAVIYFCQQGMEGGNAFADIISGKVNPSGKLTDSWASEYGDIPFGNEFSYLGDALQQYYKEGVYVGYRYYDAFDIKPRYPFGHGLSYTTFDVQCAEVKFGSVNVSVENTGSVSGKETVMLYARLDTLRLIGFKKTKLLKPKEKETLEITYRPRDIAVYDESKAGYVIPKGDIIIYVGDVQVAVLENKNEQTVEKLKNIASAGIKEIKAPKKSYEETVFTKIEVPEITAEKISYNKTRPVPAAEVEAALDRLSKKDMVELCVGEGILGMIKSTGIYAPGAVGRTTTRLFNKGIINVNLSDGPAGLRLLQKSGFTKRGKLRFVNDNYPIAAIGLLPEWVKKLAKPSKNADILYQYTTAFPVETALAQTWNEELMEKIGLAISREMEEYGITYFLGPAVNIHKNPLCGRNFEYMSEDPVLSGKMAAAIIRGIQSIEGNYATVKHFACNNSEDCRNTMNSNVNEKALREIYLRAFEICIKEGGAKSVMTSYNKLNGTYTPENRELLIDVLRNEWGFDGVVMTDWFSTGKGLAKADAAAINGNDLFMPGTILDKYRLYKSVPLDILRRNSASVLSQILSSRVNVKP